MGCACLRGDGHRRPVRGAGRVAARGWQQGRIAHQPDAAGAHARAYLLRRGGDTDAVRLADPDSDAVGIGQPIGDRNRQRLTHAMPIAVGDGDAITITEWERETLGLALGPL